MRRTASSRRAPSPGRSSSTTTRTSIRGRAVHEHDERDAADPHQRALLRRQHELRDRAHGHRLHGVEASTSVTVFPDKVNLTYDTVPSGLTLTIDGISRQTPFVVDDLKGFQRTITAPNQSSGGTAYTFASWSDGGRRATASSCRPSTRASSPPSRRRRAPAARSRPTPSTRAAARASPTPPRARTSARSGPRPGRPRQVRQRALVQRLERAGDRPRLASLRLTSGMTLEAWVFPTTVNAPGET